MSETRKTATCRLVRASAPFRGKQGLDYDVGISAESVGAGDFFYIPAGVPHLPYNGSATEPCIGVIARTDPNEQESVVLLPHLDALRAGPEG